MAQAPPKPKTVEDYLAHGCGRCDKGGTQSCKVLPWQSLLNSLRVQLQQADLTEEIKWGAPCYSVNGKNVLMLSALKDSVVVSFFAGTQLDDPNKLLEKPGENSRFARYLRFTDESQVRERAETMQQLIQQAIKLSQLPQVKTSSTVADLPEMPEELLQTFELDAEYAEAFAALTPGRQRSYLLHFSTAKQAKTRLSRIEKARIKVFSGKGFNEY